MWRSRARGRGGGPQVRARWLDGYVTEIRDSLSQACASNEQVRRLEPRADLPAAGVSIPTPPAISGADGAVDGRGARVPAPTAPSTARQTTGRLTCSTTRAFWVGEACHQTSGPTFLDSACPLCMATEGATRFTNNARRQSCDYEVGRFPTGSTYHLPQRGGYRMSHSFMRRLAAAAGAATAGLLLLAAPVQAAPAAEAADVKPSTAEPSAAEIEANNAAARAALPPNVTMTVIGKLPKYNGPADHYSQNGSTIASGVTPFAATVPYYYTFSGVRSLYGRVFQITESSTVCKDIYATWDNGYHDQFHSFHVSLEGSSVLVPADGITRSWCWSRVPTYTDHQFYYYVAGESGGHFAFTSGGGRVRYSWQ